MSTGGEVIDEGERKKRLKREANRRSAQLSRQRKKAFIEDLKAKNEEFLVAQKVLACHPDLIFAMDGAGRIQFANRAASARLNLMPSEFVDRSFFDLLDDGSRKRFRGALHDIVGRPYASSVPLGGPLNVSGNGTNCLLEVFAEAAENGPSDRSVVCVGRPYRKRKRKPERA